MATVQQSIRIYTLGETADRNLSRNELHKIVNECTDIGHKQSVYYYDDGHYVLSCHVCNYAIVVKP